MEYYFDTDDKLERRKYAEFLKSMLENCDKYRREDSDGAYVIAIDSPWGTGKTRFAKMLRNFLEGREPKVIDGKADQSFIPPAKEERKFNVIYYNSWETDYWNDAIEPLMDSILNSEAFIQFRKDKRNKEAWKNLLRFAKGVLKASGYALASKVFGETSVGIFKAGLSELKRKPINPLVRFKNKETKYIEFRKALEQVIAKTGKPLVIIVDELDRCRPIYAIQTLELVKHLFAVKGSFFIFALDVEQLSCMVRTLYGSNDAPGYLCRFFDYLGKMPVPDFDSFVNEQLKGLTPVQQFYKKGAFEATLTKYFLNLKEKYLLSLRDISTIVSTYKMLFITFLNRYADVSAHELYLCLISLKYKKLDEYETLCSGRFSETEIKKLFSEQISIAPGTFDSEGRRMVFFAQKISIENCTYPTYNYETGRSNENRRFRNFTYEITNNQEHMTYYLGTPHGNESGGYLLEDTENLGQILYYEDLKKWDQIKKMTIGQYYYQQLEMFNFALPADEPETNV